MELLRRSRGETGLTTAIGCVTEEVLSTLDRTRRDRVLELLGGALDTEVSTIARTKRCYYAAIEAKEIRGRELLLEQAAIQAVHADELAERIAELGGSPDFAAFAEPQRTRELDDRLAAATLTFRQVLEAELAAKAETLSSHRRVMVALGELDARTRELLEDILAREVEHTHALERLLASLPQLH